ncbi:MAG: toprim domain-containing protein [Brevundimonas sp.]|nr:toprim domain-containing protein [Brevundimonas sp.]
MTLRALVAALGGDLYAGGMRANVPAPGHSRSDRSVSLLLAGDRVLIHGFGAVEWREVRDHLRAQGLLDSAGRLIGAGGSVRDAGPPSPDRAVRVATARQLWDEAGKIGPASLSARYLSGRAIGREPELVAALRHHPAVPLRVYQPGRALRPALLAAIQGADGRLTAVELTYLTSAGRRDDRLRVSRKTVGLVPPGSAVRLAAPAATLVVGEGVMTVLSASEIFARPGWALLSARNLAGWTPPPGVARVLIAADRGAPGEAAAARQAARLRGFGLEARIRLPPGDADDWNAWAMERRKEGKGRAPMRPG